MPWGVFKNWVTTVAGLMSSIGGFPVALAALGYHINQTFSLVMAVIGLLGLALMGLAAKGADQHSIQSQIDAATATVKATTAPAIEKASIAVKDADEVAKK
jgi:uncharacterized membrane protein (Fun14 family)